MKALVFAVILACSTQLACGEIISGNYEIQSTALPLSATGSFTVPGGGSLALFGGGSADFNFTAGDTSTLTLSVDTMGGATTGGFIWEFTDLDIDNIAPGPSEVIHRLVFNPAASTPGASIASQAFTDDSITIRTDNFAGSTVEFSFLVSTVPEPTHFSVLALFAIGFLMLKRRFPATQ